MDDDRELTPEEERELDEWIESHVRPSRASALLTWVLLALAIFCVIEMALFPEDRFRLAAVAAISVAAIAVIRN